MKNTLGMCLHRIQGTQAVMKLCSSKSSFITEAMSCFPWLMPGWRLWLVLLLMWDCCIAEELKPTRWPLFSKRPVLLAWNAPTEDCRPRYGVHFNLDQFEIIASPNEGFVRQNLTIFYNDRLGMYPYYEKGEPVNGGLPQIASLTAHLEKMPEGVNKYIREKAKGLAVIDWEEWRPLWIRNWDTKDIYRNRSRLLVAEKNPDWPPEKVAKVAQQEFEMSAKKFMLETLRQAKSLRSEQLWGFYLFPDCYNHDYRNSLENYTGRCPDAEVARNDHLTWLWTESTALFPSIYMGTVLKSTSFGRQFVRNRVREGMRLALVGDGLARPVFVYTRPTYANELIELTQMDLISTIGESVALGAAGIIFWGEATFSSSKASCSSLNEYLRGHLGRYLLNVTTAAEHCSRLRCSSHGRCLRRRPNTDTYLHLSPLSHSIQSRDGKLEVKGQPGPAELALYRSQFRCQCYSGFQDESCAKKDPAQQKGASPGLHAWQASLLLPLLLHVLLH
ncbi:hyaluronidase-2 isoform X1 [Anguilla anguilla]|uniref:hyaluronidase-2 isoform X1 n=2 Tax=Anguilla anguilla TaxID=7936 RepID=UPI0015ABB19A|nr:hyaluronidase-2 isoform X1 [Anguilla anguilla]